MIRANFRLVDRDTAYLLPPSVDGWLPDDHRARFVVEIVDQLDISSLENDYQGSGSDAYHPRIMSTRQNGWQQAWNVQAGVCMASYLLVSGYVSSSPNDQQELDENLNQVTNLPEQLGTPQTSSLRRRLFQQSECERSGRLRH